MIQAAKKTARSQLKQILAKIPRETIETESSIVATKVIQTPQFINSKTISIFLNSPGEISTFEIMKAAFEANKRVYIPICDGFVMKMVILKDLNDFYSLIPNSWQIPEPLETDNRESTLDLDLIIMPGLGFDKEGNRIGFGKGYYDTFLSKCFQNALERKVSRPFTIAITLTAQVVDKVPVDSNDIKPDRIITAAA